MRAKSPNKGTAYSMVEQQRKGHAWTNLWDVWVQAEKQLAWILVGKTYGGLR